ncbi:sigma-70 family RNA polymerase sigma factor [Arthrobacter sp. zg-Y1116]|uniref:sigma-70 family RNA polymerase sigma factor n=1 Tax=Arthrobacter sp. zg-Y1116 TaxID=2964611 RepID=UPI0021027A2D|nr:sigma-70 family RNA polymerase sigma factor [Arthrobacter sp. zg-Y1116]MCQ1947572.1 sigma-70 family RNA polymerase sigma factor [Arthrobacter sp. zg-Y1116]
MTELTTGSEGVPGAATIEGVPTGYDYAFLYPWQQEALKAWHSNARCGVIEAVTGSGKTKVGIAAAFEAVRQGMKVLILVPTAELQRQWLSAVRADLPRVRRGALGNGHTDSLDDVDVLVAIVHTASNRATLRSHKAGLIIADECHRYAAPMFTNALQEGYAWRLGLTATYERTDQQHEAVLSPYFGGVVYTLWYDRALRDKVIAPFDIALVGVELTPSERENYDELSATMTESARILTTYAEVPRTPFHAFIAAVASLAASESQTRETTVARRYMRAMASRLTLLSDARTKYHALAALRETVDRSKGTLVFTQTQDSARRSQQVYSSMGTSASVIFSGMSDADRQQGLADFRSGTSQLLAAPRLLDEGVDVPEADLGIIVAANRSQRQMVQRLGRVIRKKVDGRAGRLVVLYSKDTVEDPDVQGEEFLGRVLPFARNVEFFDLESDLEQLEDFLNPPIPEPMKQLELFDVPVPEHTEESAASKTETSEEPSPQGFVLDDWDDDWPEVLRKTVKISPDPVHDYLGRVGGYGLLTAEEEVELAQEIEAGLYAAHLLSDQTAFRPRREIRELEALRHAGQRAADRLLNCNLRLVVSLAKGHIGRGLDFLDLIQEGNLGLHRAVRKFDYQLGNKFSTYATWWIRQAITRALADQARTIRLPVHVVEKLQKLWTAQQEPGLLGDAPSLDDLSARTGMSVEQITALLSADKSIISLELEVPNGRGGMEAMSEQLWDPFGLDTADPIIHQLMTEQIHSVLDTLPEREAGVIALRFGLVDGEEKTLDAIGQVYGVTRERIRQIESKTMKKLRHPSRCSVLWAYLYDGDGMAPGAEDESEASDDAA